jgi:hypothetical protein
MDWFLALLLLAAPAPVRLPPVDQCAADASFGRFRAELLEAIERRDEDHVLSIIADDIMVDFGGGHGSAAFTEAWALDRPKESRLWAELAEILRLGCTIGEGTASAPSLMHQLPAERDGFMTLLAVRPDAVLRAAMSDGSPALRRLDWDLLTLADKGGDETWAPITLGGDRTGYVRRGHVRSPVDYRAIFQKRNGRWEMTALVAGD